MWVDPIPDLKTLIGGEIAKRIAKRGQWEVAVWIGTDQPRVSELRRGKLERFSLETLIRYLSKLRCRVTVTLEDVPYPKLRKTRQRSAKGCPGARSAGARERALVRAQHGVRIHPHGAQCRDQARKRRSDEQHHGDACEYDRIACRLPEQQRLDPA
jgi:predicted XRE-type DNA-binding protein